MRKGTISLNDKEQQRLMVLNQVERGELSGEDAAVLMGLGLRQVRRLLAAYRKEGGAALAHGNRGRRPVHALSGGDQEAGGSLGSRPIRRLQSSPFDGASGRAGRLGGEPVIGVAYSDRRRVEKLPASPTRPSTAAVEYATLRRECSCRSMAVSTTGWKEGDHT